MLRKILKWFGIEIIKGKSYEYEVARLCDGGSLWIKLDGGPYQVPDVPELSDLKFGEVKKYGF
jgi:hypothetical protein